MSARDNDEAREKYKRVVALERMAEEERRPALRAVARRWPGALREAELVSPEAMAARTEAARGLVAGEPRRGGGAPRGEAPRGEAQGLSSGTARGARLPDIQG